MDSSPVNREVCPGARDSIDKLPLRAKCYRPLTGSATDRSPYSR